MERRDFVLGAVSIAAGCRRSVGATFDHLPTPVCLWDFSGDRPLVSKGKNSYVLREGNGAVAQVEEGKFKALDLCEGQYLYIPRSECPGLDLHGKHAQVTVTAWLKRGHKHNTECEAIAGVWNETRQKRQYCMFLNLGIYGSKDQIAGHISGVGGPTPGQRWCMDASIGASRVPSEWFFAAITYDGLAARSYLNGVLDIRPGRNPYPYGEGIYDGGKDGADFTVGGVHRAGSMGNFFVGKLAQLAVFDRALNDNEILRMYRQF